MESMPSFPDPFVLVKTTRSSGDRWVTSGTVTFGLGADHQQLATLSFEFQDAESQKAAIQQAAQHLKTAAASFDHIADHFQR